MEKHAIYRTLVPILVIFARYYSEIHYYNMIIITETTARVIYNLVYYCELTTII